MIHVKEVQFKDTVSLLASLRSPLQVPLEPLVPLVPFRLAAGTCVHAHRVKLHHHTRFVTQALLTVSKPRIMQ